MDLIHFARETIVGFIRECRRDNPFYASAAGSISKKSRVNSVAGNDSERVWNFHETKLTRERRSSRRASANFNHGGDA